MTLLAFILLAYLLGSISFGVLASWVFQLPDPRTYGSKNPGATNVLRSGKKAAAALTLLGDAGKGWVAVALAHHFARAWGLGDEAIAAAALAVFWVIYFQYFYVLRVEKEWLRHSAYCLDLIRGWGCWPLQPGFWSQ